MNSLLKKGIFGLAFVFIFMVIGTINVYAEEIFVKDLSGEPKPYSVDLENEQIGDLKDIIATEKGVDFRKILLIFAGNELSNEKTFSECNIQKEDTLHLVIRNILAIDVYGDGQIAYAKDDEDLVYNDEITALINKSDTYKIGAKANEGYEFVKWTLNDEDYSTDSEITMTLDNEDIELVAVFQSTQKEEYTIETDDDNFIITFTDIEMKFHQLNITEYLSITDEQLQYLVDLLNDPEYTLELLKEQLDKIISYGKKAANGQGELLKLYDIELSENLNEIHEADGGFKLKIKITDDIKGYDSYKLVYIDENGQTEDAIELTQNGDYLEGTLEHLSMYALVGSKTENIPSTGDNIIFYISMLGLSIVGLIGTGLYTRKKKFN